MYTSPYSVVVNGCNNKIQLDIAITNYGSHNIGIFLGYSNDSFINQTTYLSKSNPYFVAAINFNNDFLLDIIIDYYVTNNLLVSREDYNSISEKD